MHRSSYRYFQKLGTIVVYNRLHVTEQALLRRFTFARMLPCGQAIISPFGEN